MRIAFYDFDGTLVSSNLVTRYASLIQRMPSRKIALWKTLRLISSVPTYLVLDRFSRRLFNQAFFQEYRGVRRAWLEQQAEGIFERLIRPAIRPAALELVQQDRQEGFRLILVTGEIGSLLAPVARYFGFDSVVCNSLIFRNGIATGEVAAPLIAGGAKVLAMDAECRNHGSQLSRAKAYSDSFSDVPMLEAVGSPAAVNPDTRLRKLATARGWPVLDLGGSGRRTPGAAARGNHVHVS
ncbi:MAG: HAD family hydrolase [Terriglobia bacterium]